MPSLIVTAAMAAWRRRKEVRGRGDRIAHHLERTHLGGFERLRCELDVPASRVGETLEAASGLVAEGAAAIALTVGCVGIVPGEEPVLVALAPHRDLVARRVLGTLAADEGHRHPQLFLALTPGTYLARVVDPYAPFSADERSILAMLRGGGVAHALLTEISPERTGTRLALTVYARRPMLRTFLNIAERALGSLPGWSPANTTAAKTPKTA